MSDLDELASAARGGTSGQRPQMVPDYMPPDQPRRPWVIWVALALGICFGLGVTMVVIWLGRSAGVPVVTPLAPAVAVPTTGPALLTSGAPPVALPQPVAQRTTPRTRAPLEDIDDPFQALDIYHLERGVGNAIEIKARNRSKRGLFIKSVELYAESNERVPLDNIGFWLPPGDLVVATREVLELSRRLGPNEPIKAVINEAEFRDAPPEDMADRPSGTSTRRDAAPQ